ncbi:CBU_0592 family membrane protein [Sphingopyxis sp. 22461]
MSAEVIVIEIIGWAAAAIILAAYILLSLGRLDGRSYLYQ